MKYILTVTAKRKNAKRHIVERNSNKEHLLKLAKENLNKDRYIVEIYNAKWELLEAIR